ncbi:MAG: winged helix-turn-helix domain-containing protein [Anaerolineae bacterium]|nr:winged helix-turn-helix domain-containing protein [Anaerolineae bacterium]
MTLFYKEASFPADYREAEVGQIMNALYKLRSIALNGLAGMGKSNVVRFVVSHPQVKPRYLKERPANFVFIHLDCAGLGDGSEIELLSELLLQLRATVSTPSDAPLPADGRNLRRALKEQLLALPPALTPVVAFDYFDEAAAATDHTFFNYLFFLRNCRPQGNLAYIFVTRRPVGSFFELHELLDETCFIGPLNTKDALESLQRDEARLGHTFDPYQRTRLLDCTGGHPGFLKNAIELAAASLDLRRPEETLARQLLQWDNIKRLAEELWADLTPAEQETLLAAAQNPLPAALPETVLLERFGLLKLHQGRLVIFCPLFAMFIRQFKAPPSGAVQITAVFPNQACLKTAAGEEQLTLPPLLFALLLAFAQSRPAEILPTDSLVTQIYGPEAAGVSNAALSQLVKRLREALDPPIRLLLDDPTFSCVETIRDVGYRLTAGCTASPPP